MSDKYGSRKLYELGITTPISSYEELTNEYGFTEEETDPDLVEHIYLANQDWGQQIDDQLPYLYDESKYAYFVKQYYSNSAATTHWFSLDQLLRSVYDQNGSKQNNINISPTNKLVPVENFKTGESVKSFQYLDPSDNTYKYLVQPLVIYNTNPIGWLTESEMYDYSYKISDIAKPLYFTNASSSPSSVTLNMIGTLTTDYETSTDGEHWSPYTLGTPITLPTFNSKVYFRGTRSNQSSSNYLNFSMSGLIESGGNINSLLEKQDFTDLNLSDYGSYTFKLLFFNCTSLLSAPLLPSKRLSDWCYYGMFKNCTSLNSVQKILPTETFYPFYYCYRGMFYGCTSLEKSPILLAKQTAGTWCYYEMFSGCTSLTSVHCYAESIKSTNDVTNMLPSNIGNFYCYDTDIWKGYIPVTWTKYLVKPLCFMKHTTSSVSTVALLVNGSLTTDYETSSDGLNWEPYTIGTSITLKTDNDRVYFRGSRSVQSLANYLHFSFTGKVNSYGNINSLLSKTNFHLINDYSSEPYTFRYLFIYMSSLYTAPVLPTIALNTYSYSSMFFRCTSLQQAPKLPAITLNSRCYYGMFDGCTSLTQTPKLPAETYVSNAYQSMFRGCTSLNYVYTRTKQSTASNWLSGVSSSGDFVCIPNTWTIDSTSGIPVGWTKYDLIDYTPYLANTTSWGAELPYSTTLEYNSYDNTYSFITSDGSDPLLGSDTFESNSFTLQQLLTGVYSNLTHQLSDIAISPSNTEITVYKQDSGEACDAFIYNDPHDNVDKYLIKAEFETVDKANFRWLTEDELIEIGYTLEVPSLGTILNLTLDNTDVTLYRGDSSNLYVDNTEVVLPTNHFSILLDSAYNANDDQLDTSELKLDVNSDTLSLPSSINRPVTIKMLSDGPVCFETQGNLNNFNVEYSINDGPWNSYVVKNPGTDIELSAGDEIAWRCPYGNHPGSKSYDNYVRFRTTADIKLYGNIASTRIADRYAIPWADNRITTSTEFAFNRMFVGCSGYIDASNLYIPMPGPDEHYQSNCGSYCADMFSGCTGLVKAPDLSHLTIAGTYSFAAMFLDCTSLIEPPPFLPAKYPGYHSYDAMFLGCTSLTKSPKINFEQFYGSSQGDGAMQWMFAGCTSLSEVYCNVAFQSGANRTYEWLDSVSNEGTIYLSNDANWPLNSVSGVPTGWKISGYPLRAYPYTRELQHLNFTLEANTYTRLYKPALSEYYSLNSNTAYAVTRLVDRSGVELDISNVAIINDGTYLYLVNRNNFPITWKYVEFIKWLPTQAMSITPLVYPGTSSGSVIILNND